MKKEKNTKKILTGVVALALGAIIGVGILTTPTNTKEKTVDYTSQIKVEEVLSQGIQLERKVIPASSFAEEGINSQASAVQTVTATVTPDSAGTQRLTWTLDWVDETDSWVTSLGMPADNFVKMTVSADTKTVTLESLRAFGAQIMLTATAKTNSEAKAQCTIDYWSRIHTVRGTMGSYNLTGESITHVYDISTPKGAETAEPQIILGDHTVENPEKTISISVTPNSELFTTSYFDTTEYYNDWVLGYLPVAGCDILSWTFKNGQKASEMDVSDIVEIMSSWEIGTKLYTVTISWTMSGESGSVSTDILFGGVIDTAITESVSLSSGSIIL